LGRSRGGLTTKIHAGCIDENTVVSFTLTAGQCHDAPEFKNVFDKIKKEHYLEQAVMDKAYGSKDIRNILEQNKIEPVIPCKSNSKEQIAHDKESYKLRNKVERFFNKIKQFRRIATRYEKLSRTFKAFIHIVSCCLGLRQKFVNTP